MKVLYWTQDYSALLVTVNALQPVANIEDDIASLTSNICSVSVQNGTSYHHGFYSVAYWSKILSKSQ